MAESNHRGVKCSAVNDKKGNIPDRTSTESDIDRKEAEIGEKTSGIPIDRGWAWMTVVASFTVHLLAVSAAHKSFGVFFVEFQRKFQATSQATAWISSLAQCIGLSSGPLVGVIASRYTARVAVCSGALIISVGIITSIFAPSLQFLYFSYGIIVGVGTGLTYSPSVSVLGQYFVRRRALANGIGAAGAGVGGFLMPHLLTALLVEYSLTGTLLIMAALMLNLAVCGALLRPIQFYTTKRFTSTTKQGKISSNLIYKVKVGKSTEMSACQSSDKQKLGCEEIRTRPETNQGIPGKNTADNDQDISSASTNLAGIDGVLIQCQQRVDDRTADAQLIPGKEAGESPTDTGSETLNGVSPFRITPDTKSNPSSLTVSAEGAEIVVNIGEEEGRDVGGSPSFDWRVVARPEVYVLGAAILLMHGATATAIMFLPSLGISLGLSDSHAALLLSLQGAGDLCGRVLLGWAADLNLTSKTRIFVGVGLVAGVSILGMQGVGDSMAGLGSLGFTFGVGAGSIYALPPVILAEKLGPELLQSGFSILTVFMGLPFLFMPAVGGYLEDHTGSWTATYYLTGCILILGSLIPLYLICTEHNKEITDTTRTTDVFYVMETTKL